MGLILDTSLLINAERRAGEIDFHKWEGYGEVFISAITVSELLEGVHRASNEEVRTRRSAFAEAIIAKIPAIDFTADIARIHAECFAGLSRAGDMVDAHALLIAATALRHGYVVGTTNPQVFRRIPGLEVLAV